MLDLPNVMMPLPASQDYTGFVAPNTQSTHTSFDTTYVPDVIKEAAKETADTNLYRSVSMPHINIQPQIKKSVAVSSTIESFFEKVAHDVDENSFTTSQSPVSVKIFIDRALND